MSGPGNGGVQCILATILFCFGIVVFWISRDVSKADEMIGVVRTNSLRLRESASSGIFALRTVQIKNGYDYDVAIYYEDGMSGSYLSNIPPHDIAKVSASTGHVIYATEINGMARLSHITVEPDRNVYVMQGAGESSASSSHSLSIKDNEKSSFWGNATITLNTRKSNKIHLQLVPLTGPRPKSLACKFRNMIPGKVDLYFVPRQGKPIFEGHIPFTHITTTNAYQGHHFFVVMHKESPDVPANRLCFVTVQADQVLYVFYDNRDPDSNNVEPIPAEAKKLADEEQAFMSAYKEKTGIHWRHYFGPLTFQKGEPIGPRPPPKIFMWPAESVGDVHEVVSPHSYWHCAEAHCQDTSEPISLELEAISTVPRAFLIKDFISDYEAEAIIASAGPRLGVSHVGGKDQGTITSKTRTSTNAWLARHSSPITETLYRRAADVLNIDEALMHHDKNVEDLQVVHYSQDQKYESHHDWGLGATEASRVLTLLVYLTDQPSMDAGGETSFPKAVGRDGHGYKVRPKKGTAVLFYNLLEDGNGDDFALHSALPVRQGEKYAANIWVWDPRR